MGNGMNKVLPGLFVGNYRDSKDAAQLDRFNITHILAIHDAARKLHSDKHYLCVMASDTPDQNLQQYFSLCNDFIHGARLRGGNVLIHCLAGMSRSVTVAVAYIMSVTSLSWKEALKVVRVGRAVANPNFGFQRQLQEFESCRLAEERRRLKERYPSLALQSSDEELCRQLLLSYQGLLMSKDLCEGRCPMGQPCPTGLCRSPSKRTVRRKSSTQSLGGGRSTPPTSPRMLPATPTGPPGTGRPSSGGTQGGLVRSGSSISYRHRPSVSSAPPSRSSSRTDLPNTLVRTGSALDHHGGWMSSSGPGAGPMSGSRRSVGSAPTSPRGSPAPSPPVTPAHVPRAQRVPPVS
ncbi:dual specificity protein phosphatase 15-like isoform X1 [Frankliniella occidentalis]|uniref:Dual specificity protein phosphatase 15 n=1 Tax=Frankliniella occidentalis TaxID=133901 RepID=A0A6J1S061_FRAOC|nr:dual specificity protein phosphatase 15-like isoform X2 [Frankliniella occidentalis]XP_052121656.1 dual specificity protein phosphatase 15-like isoform X1 [Frankliniella occidentalis]